jgi:hypothetical protein
VPVVRAHVVRRHHGLAYPRRMTSSASEIDLEALLDAARAADRATRVETYRDAIAVQGAPAIAKISAWFTDPTNAHFAVAVIERAGREFGYKADAIRVLRTGRRTDDAKEVWSFIDSALTNLGARAPVPPGLRDIPVFQIPLGTQVAPPYRDAHHIVVDHVPDSGTRWGDIYSLRAAGSSAANGCGIMRVSSTLLACCSAVNADMRWSVGHDGEPRASATAPSLRPWQRLAYGRRPRCDGARYRPDLPIQVLPMDAGI